MRAAPVLAVLFVAAFVAPAVVGAKSADPVNPPPPPNEKVFVQFIDPRLPIDGEVLQVDVLFNPKEFAIDKAVPWQHHRNTEGDRPSLEFTAGEPHSINITLMFDGFESQTDVGAMLAPLQKFVVGSDDRHAAPALLFTWGKTSFQGVLASYDLRFTLFLEDGTPCRATATLNLSEAKPVGGLGHETGGSGNQTQG